MLGIAVSEADDAAEHVAEHLFALADWERREDAARPPADGGGTVYHIEGVELRTFAALHLDTAGVAAAFDDPDLIVFPSRHAGDTGRLLTAHHTGNFGDAEYGGEPRALARACPHAHRRVLAALREHAPEEYDVGTECTHHGPSDVGAPSMFVEVGSGPEQWTDPDAARAVARAILDLRGVGSDADREDGTRRHLVGFGGGHYAPRFERVSRETDWAVGHVAADWALADLDPDADRAVIERAFAESAADYALLAEGGERFAAVIEDLGYRPVDETWVRETDGVPLGLVARLEDAVATIDDGLRFGAPAAGYEGDVTVVDLPDDLLAAARGIDAGAVREAVADVALAFDTEQSGTQVTGPFAVHDVGDREALIDALADLLAADYDAVGREDGALVARETAFDPDLARERGVSEGPAFGRLADGEAVEVDGEAVAPDDVTRERVRRFEL
ncbi:MAG: D-aminoacyl-tRNA deacylase [Haloarculaceae archaeon]